MDDKERQSEFIAWYMDYFKCLEAADSVLEDAARQRSP